MLQSDIDSLTSWTEQNFLCFNADKCKYMVISRKRQINLSLESQPPLQINSVTMERVDNYKYLGVWITSNLSWNKHISEVCRKARQKVGILYRKCYKNANNATMLKLYLSCIRPELEYGLLIKRVKLTLLNLFRNLHCVYVLGIGTPITIPCSPQITFQVCQKEGYFYV